MPAVPGATLICFWPLKNNPGHISTVAIVRILGMLLSRARIYFATKSGEEEGEGEDARRFIPGYLAPVPAHLLDCPACSNIRGANGQSSCPTVCLTFDLN
jgi:hypothetical protein